jgi:predicted Rossmann fold nucleotide-binding protein DprA/Smf involved in DNA uptake
LAEGGTVIGVVGDTLLERSLSRDARAGLAEGRLLLVSPYYPEAAFNTGNAMARNKLIYAFADYGLVICSGHRKGGTWEGAVEEIRRKLGRPVFVRVEGTVPEGNRRLLEEGALPFPALRGEPLTLEWLQQAAATGQRPPSAIELSLLLSIEAPRPSAEEVREPRPEPIPESVQINTLAPATIYDTALRAILGALDEPKSVEELAVCLACQEITKSQMQIWLKRAVADGAISKLTRPVRYVRKDAEPVDASQ